MARKTHLQRAQSWMARQERTQRSRDADYSTLSRKMTLCYEPAVMLSKRNESTLHDLLQRAKKLQTISKFEL